MYSCGIEYIQLISCVSSERPFSLPSLRLQILASDSITESICYGRQKQLHECSGRLFQVGVVLRHGWVEGARGSRVAESKLNGVPVNKVEGCVCEMARVRVIVAGSRGRVEIGRWGDGIGTLGDSRHGTAHPGSDSLVDGGFGGWCVFSISFAGTWCVGEDATDGVVGGVLEVHVRVLGLVVVTSPAVENVSGVGVEIDKVADLGVAIQHPFDGFGLRLRESGSPYEMIS